MEQEENFVYGVEVELDKPDSFLLIKETLTRIGIKSKRDNTIYQSCHILHRRGKYYIIHFLELFSIDGRGNNMTDEDYARRNSIARLLSKWKLCKILNIADVSDSSPETPIDVIMYRDKNEYKLVSKYTVGSKKNK